MKYIACWLLLGLGLLAEGQKYDNYWIYGRYPNGTGYFGNGDLEFMEDSLRIAAHQRNQAFGITCMSLSDKFGNFLAHSDGLSVKDTSNQIIENGDSLNYGLYWDAVYPQQQTGQASYSIFQAIHALPLPDSDSIFFIFQLLSNGTLQAPSWVNSKVCYSKLMISDNGNLRLEEKNTPISGIYPPSGPGSIASCKHANGRDWWIIYNEINSNCLHKYILSPSGLSYFGVQCIGDTVLDRVGIKSIFSPDGSKFARYATNIVDVFYFDRCYGDLSNLVALPRILTYDSTLQMNIHNLTSLEFSENNRFLYAIHQSAILQYDLWNANPNLSIDTIATLDYFVDTVPDAGQGFFHFFQSQTGPDGKIYICSYNGMRFLCTIDSPNGKGDSCQFGMRDVVLPKFWRLSMPYYPNYRLGRLVGSACDTIYSDIRPIYTQAPWLKVYPNPASDLVRFDYNWIEWETISDCELRITDMNGRVVLSQKVPKYSTRQDVSIKGLAEGLYTVSIQSGQRQIAVTKLTKQ